MVNNLRPKATIVILETALLAFASSHVATAGIRDISQRSFIKGSCKFLLGASGLAYSAFHLYDYLFPQSAPMDIRLQSFVNQHFNDTGIIDVMKKSIDLKDVGLWKSLGSGISKRAYGHPELHDYVLKIDKYKTSFWENRVNKVSAVRAHFENSQYAREVIDRCNFNKLFIPESYLIESNFGPALLERKVVEGEFMHMSKNSDLLARYNHAVSQLESFLNETGFCDIQIYYSHNAYWTPDERIALFDFDCRRT